MLIRSMVLRRQVTALSATHSILASYCLILTPSRCSSLPASTGQDSGWVGEDVGKAPLGMLSGCDADRDFNWQEDRRPRHEGDIFIYEMHVRGFTMNPNSEVGLDQR
ncbi:hypothetical protein BH10ACI4_BH10ACI4_23860 [soil metagenome]